MKGLVINQVSLPHETVNHYFTIIKSSEQGNKVGSFSRIKGIIGNTCWNQTIKTYTKNSTFKLEFK